MNAIEIFSAAIRVIGLLSFARGFDDIIYFVIVYLGIKPASVTAAPPYVELIYGIFYLLIGLYMLRGAPFIIDYAFPIEDVGENPDNANPETSQDK